MKIKRENTGERKSEASTGTNYYRFTEGLPTQRIIKLDFDQFS
jgi:hypothetical protein